MKSITDWLDTPGGHILVCLALIFIGAGLWKCGVPKAEDVLVSASTGVFMAMRGIGNDNNKT